MIFYHFTNKKLSIFNRVFEDVIKKFKSICKPDDIATSIDRIERGM